MPFVIQHGGGAGADMSQAANIIWQSRLERAKQEGFLAGLGRGIGQGMGQGISRGVELGMENRFKREQLAQQQQFAQQLEMLQQDRYDKRQQEQFKAERMFKLQMEQEQQFGKELVEGRDAYRDATIAGRIPQFLAKQRDEIFNEMTALETDANLMRLPADQVFEARRALQMREAAVYRQIPPVKSEVEAAFEALVPGGVLQQYAVEVKKMDPKLAAKVYKEDDLFGRDRSGSYRPVSKAKDQPTGKYLMPGSPEAKQYGAGEGYGVFLEDGQAPKYINTGSAKQKEDEDYLSKAGPIEVQRLRQTAIENWQRAHHDAEGKPSTTIPPDWVIDRDVRSIIRKPDEMRALQGRESSLDQMGEMGQDIRRMEQYVASMQRERPGLTLPVLMDELIQEIASTGDVSDPEVQRQLRHFAEMADAYEGLPQ